METLSQTLAQLLRIIKVMRVGRALCNNCTSNYVEQVRESAIQWKIIWKYGHKLKMTSKRLTYKGNTTFLNSSLFLRLPGHIFVLQNLFLI